MSLEPRIIKGFNADYVRAAWTGKNESGLRPIGTSILVLMDQCAEGSSGEAGAALLKEAGMEAVNPASLLAIPPEVIEKMNHASESGIVVAVGSAAFRYYDDGSTWTDYKPKPGDHVFIERYAGREIRGADGRTYRMMTYTNVGGLHDDAATIVSQNVPSVPSAVEQALAGATPAERKAAQAHLKTVRAARKAPAKRKKG